MTTKKKGLLSDPKFLAWANKGIYQPIPIAGMNFPSVRSPWCELRWEYISHVLPEDESQKILDIGCYLGFFGIMGAFAGHKVDGFDKDKESVYWGNRIVHEFGIPGVRLWDVSDDLLANLKAIPSNSYDYVFYLSVHHHMCAKLGIEKANEIFQEISRIAPNMIFDMGQSNEVDNGWLTWLRKIPQFENHRKEIVEWVLENSRYKYGGQIGFSMSHQIQRKLFLFISEAPDVSYTRDLITVPVDMGIVYAPLGLRVTEYIWRGIGSIGELYSSKERFPVMDLNAQMSRRYYRAKDLDGKREYFVCEYLYSWLSPKQNTNKALKTYQRGAELAKVPELRGKIVPPEFAGDNFIVYRYYNWPQLLRVHASNILCFPNIVEAILETAEKIHEVIGVFDFNANNILFNPRTGHFLFVDFEDIDNAPNFTEELFRKRIDSFVEHFEKEALELGD